MDNSQSEEYNIIDIDTKNKKPWKIIINGRGMTNEISSITLTVEPQTLPSVALGYNAKAFIESMLKQEQE